VNWNVLTTRSGHKTVCLHKSTKEFLLHSKYNPIKEAEKWVAQWEISKFSPKSILVIGLGAGYHINQLHLEFPDIPKIIWEFNPEYVKWLNKSGILENFGLKHNIKLIVSDDWEKIRGEFLPLLDKPGIMVLLHSPSFELIPEKLEPLKKHLENHVIFLRTVRRHANELEKNFHLNLSLEASGINQWENQLINKSAILISAGPSLTKQLPNLAKIHEEGKIFLACVGTALKPLLRFGIKPDIIMVSDPQDNIKEQFIQCNDKEIPLFYLATANHKAVANYRGSRFIVWQKGFTQSEMQAKLRGEPQIQTGGSVATCLLDLLVWMGSKRIAVVGQDLAFSNGYSHAEGTHGIREVLMDNTIEITDYYQQGKIGTSKNLYIYLQWFEKYKQNLNKNIELWNCTEGGAYIPGWVHMPLLEFANIG
jgi:hypothetical protein